MNKLEEQAISMVLKAILTRKNRTYMVKKNGVPFIIKVNVGEV